MSSCAVQRVAIDHGASEGVCGIRKPYLSDGTNWARDEQHVSTRCGVVAMRGDIPAALITRPLLGQIPDDQFSLLRRVVVLYRRSQPEDRPALTPRNSTGCRPRVLGRGATLGGQPAESDVPWKELSMSRSSNGKRGNGSHQPTWRGRGGRDHRYPLLVAGACARPSPARRGCHWSRQRLSAVVGYCRLCTGRQDRATTTLRHRSKRRDGARRRGAFVHRVSHDVAEADT